MNNLIFEAAGPFAKLPKHWIKYLASRYGKGQGYGQDMAGEHSIITPIKEFDPGKIKKALKDKNNLAIIGRVQGKPLFMIAQHYAQSTKFNIFETTPGEGHYESKGLIVRRGGRRYRIHVHDSYNINEVVDIIDKLFQEKQLDFSGLTIEAISKDPVRGGLVQQRRQSASIVDPLYTEPSRWSSSLPSKSQLERGKKYAAIKRPKLDASVDVEKQKIKDQINNVIDGVLDNVIKDVKKGYTFSVDKKSFAEKMVYAIDLSGIQRLAKAYSALGSDYDRKSPAEMARELKSTGLA